MAPDYLKAHTDGKQIPKGTTPGRRSRWGVHGCQRNFVFKPSTPAEIEFYQNIQSKTTSSDDDAGQQVPLAAWMPTFVGTLVTGVAENVSIESWAPHTDPELAAHLASLRTNPGLVPKENPILVLENLLVGFSKPNILDIKLGRVLYDELVSEDKKLRMQKVSNETTSGSLGIRICGIKMQRTSKTELLNPSFYQMDEENYVAINKLYGRALAGEEVDDAFKLFFGNENLSEDQIRILYNVFYKRLMLFYNTLLDEEIRMVSSSLLFIYEGDSACWEELNNEHELVKGSILSYLSDSDEEEEADEKQKYLSSLSLIDFAHSTLQPGAGYDENVIVGVESLLKVFERLTTSH
ncbi:LADA_0C01508g1_1 [Lachancea dasiensis]|uniref:Kinase n=1 Tax=Lachancea dasiensis TaxID=1072105 RepID=A0A1G4IXQ4_9SACH|nr:LADA_0C01508g1_1 [Lachancea dasiensis]